MPLILATWEAKIGKISILGQPGQIDPHFQNNQRKMDWRCDRDCAESVCFPCVKLSYDLSHQKENFFKEQNRKINFTSKRN
jgi:hypothetical protein